MNKKELLQLEKILSRKINPFDKKCILTFEEAKEFFQFQKKEFIKSLIKLEKRIENLEKKKHA
jgi:hypothetical protein